MSQSSDAETAMRPAQDLASPFPEAHVPDSPDAVGAAAAAASAQPSLAPFSNIAMAVLLGVLLALALVLFYRLPEIDRSVASWFFVETTCGSGMPAGAVCGWFPLRDSPPFMALRQFLQYLPVALAAALGIASLVRMLMGPKLERRRLLQAAAVFWTYVLSVGLVVNGIFKEFWGRPRPVQTDVFGGDFPFVPAGEISSYCAKNCSFFSGEAAAAAWLICLVCLLPPRYASVKPLAYGVAIALTLATSVLRMSFGAHYLSDVVVASLTTLLVFSLLAMAAARFATARA